ELTRNLRRRFGVMGQTLSEPVTTKESATCEDKRFKVGSSCMQGWRINMEDAHTHILSLPKDEGTAFFAVYDGHGGAKVSQYAGANLHDTIYSQAAYSENIEDALRSGFLALDEQMKNDDDMKDDMSGTTAVAIIVKNGIAYCANVGDSRAVLSVNGRAVPLSYDHKPANEKEAKRIVAAGGWVEFNRVNGNLALSRALGDFAFKRNPKKSPEEQMVTAYPDVIRMPLVPETHEFILLACDGIWDVMTNQEVVDFVRERVAIGKDAKTICEELLSRCLAPDCQMGGLGCDNMTAVLVLLAHGNPIEELIAKCRQAREEGGEEESHHDEDYGTPSASPSDVRTKADGDAHDNDDDEEDGPPTEFTAN
ncbi:ppm-2, partial [Pristionchus pacificus]